MTQTEIIIRAMKQLDDWYWNGFLTMEEYEAQMTAYRIMLQGCDC
jgi:hypothetical protein